MAKARKVPSAAVAGAITTGAVMAGGAILGEVIRSQLVAPTRARTLLDTTVQFTARGTVILPGVHKSWAPIMGLRTARSVYRLGPLPKEIDPSRTSGCERTFTKIFGPDEPPGTYGARFYTYHWFTAQDAGLVEEYITVPTPYGSAPAKIWKAPQSKNQDTWVIGVHGRAAVHEELLRHAVITCSRGLPFMAMSYRNDQVGGPHTDGVSRLGATEWEDLDWAIRQAQHMGAKRIILLGASQGASLVAFWLARATDNPDMLVCDPSQVIGIILDSPLIRGTSALRAAIHSSGVPSGIDKIVTMAASGWMGVRGPQRMITVDHLPLLEQTDMPTLLFVGKKDTMIRPGPAIELADAAHVTSIVSEMGEHVEIYNEEEERYTEVMAAWLQKVTEPAHLVGPLTRSLDDLPPFSPTETDEETDTPVNLRDLETEQIITSEDA